MIANSTPGAKRRGGAFASIRSTPGPVAPRQASHVNPEKGSKSAFSAGFDAGVDRRAKPPGAGAGAGEVTGRECRGGGRLCSARSQMPCGHLSCRESDECNVGAGSASGAQVRGENEEKRTCEEGARHGGAEGKFVQRHVPAEMKSVVLDSLQLQRDAGEGLGKYETGGDDQVGRLLIKYFHGRPYLGKVMGFVPGECARIWAVVYNDGDREELDEAELKECVARAAVGSAASAKQQQQLHRHAELWIGKHESDLRKRAAARDRKRAAGGGRSAHQQPAAAERASPQAARSLGVRWLTIPRNVGARYRVCVCIIVAAAAGALAVCQWKIKMHGYLCLASVCLESCVKHFPLPLQSHFAPPAPPAPPLPSGGKQDLPNGADAQLKDLIERTSAAHPRPLSAGDAAGAAARDAAGAAEAAVWSML